MRFLQVIAAILLFAAPVHAFSDNLHSGDMLFVQNSHNLVECYTKSSFSHVAVVVKYGDKTWVYEAEPPVVKRYTIEEWLTAMGDYNTSHPQSPALVTVVTPNRPYSDAEVSKMKEFLETQVGRRYSVRGYLRNVQTNGTHCSEMCAAAIEATGRRDFSAPNRTISPGDLHGLLRVCHHQLGKQYHVVLRDSEKKSWCERSAAWWARRPSWCAWSCWETLRFYP